MGIKLLLFHRIILIKLSTFNCTIYVNKQQNPVKFGNINS